MLLKYLRFILIGTPSTFTVILALNFSSLYSSSSTIYIFLFFILSLNTSVLSGRFTVCDHPKYSLTPIKIFGVPGYIVPMILVPSSLLRWTSYHEVGPSSGWCVFIARKVSPDLVLLLFIAKTLDPVKFWSKYSSWVSLFKILPAQYAPSLDMNSWSWLYINIILGVIGKSFL